MTRFVYRILITCPLLLSVSALYSQNTGIGTVNPTHTLHVKTEDGNPNLDPLRVEGMLEYLSTGDTAIVLVNPDSGILRILHIDSLMRNYGVNIYNTDGNLVKDITVGMNSYGLTFLGTDTIYLSNDGNLGIGTKDPSGSLHVVDTKHPVIPSLSTATQGIFENDGEVRVVLLSSNTSQSTLSFGDQDEEDPGAISYLHTSDQMQFQTNGSTSMTIDSLGYVGVGTTTPQAPLHITGANNINPETYILGGDNDSVFSNYSDEFSTLANAGTGLDYSIISEDRIAASAFNAYSDLRIKKDIQAAQNAEDLEKLRALKVKSYKYIDEARKGRDLQKGFIAQEVAETFPQAVGFRTGIVPNLFQTPIFAQWKDGLLYLKLASTHGLKVGDRVKIIEENGERIIVVDQVQDSTAFSAQTDRLNCEKIFVYGSEVKDFHTLDYDEIFTLNVSATQALADEVDELKKQLAKQQQLIELLLQQNQDLRASQEKKVEASARE